MKDLTQGSTTRHIVSMALPIALGMLFQTLYDLVDLYFVGWLGDAAIAGVSAGGNIMLIVLGMTQVLGVGTVALISHAVGRRDRFSANLFFNQAILLSALCGGVTLVGGYGVTRIYMSGIGADAATTEAGVTYLYWFLPGMALQFALVSMSAALRGTGIVKPTMIAQATSVMINVILAPVLIAGWGTDHPMGVAGAGLASTIAVSAAVAMLGIYFFRLEKYVSFDRALWKPQLAQWKRVFAIGLPTGGEFLLMFVYMGVIYMCIRDFGPDAQAGFGVGSRVMQSIFLPAMAIAFAAGPIVGQNFGARQANRVHETFKIAAKLSMIIMAVLTILVHVDPSLLVRAFADDPEVLVIAAEFLRITSWNFIAVGLVFTCSSVFQGLGDTRPALLSTASRIVMFAIPAVWLSQRPGFRLAQMWYLSVAAQALQALFSLWLARMQMRRKLGMEADPGSVPA